MQSSQSVGTLTREQQQSYKEDGYLFPIRVMSEDEAKAILEKARQREQQYQADKREERRQMEIIPIDRDW